MVSVIRYLASGCTWACQRTLARAPFSYPTYEICSTMARFLFWLCGWKGPSPDVPETSSATPTSSSIEFLEQHSSNIFTLETYMAITHLVSTITDFLLIIFDICISTIRSAGQVVRNSITSSSLCIFLVREHELLCTITDDKPLGFDL